MALEITLDSEEVHTVADALDAWVKSGHDEASDLLKYFQEEIYMHCFHSKDCEEEVRDTERKLFHFDPFVD